MELLAAVSNIIVFWSEDNEDLAIGRRRAVEIHFIQNPDRIATLFHALTENATL
jgi:hypothetical protein